MRKVFYVDKQYQEVWEMDLTEKYKHSVHIRNITEAKDLLEYSVCELPFTSFGREPISPGISTKKLKCPFKHKYQFLILN